MSVGARQVIASSVLLLSENILRLAAIAVVSFWIARDLGPDQFGILNFASAFMAILLSVAALGMDTPLILRLTRAKQPGPLLGTALFIRGASSVLVFVAATGIAFALKGDDALSRDVTLIVSLCILGYIPNVIDCWFKAKTSAAGPVLARTIATLASVVGKVACLLLGLGVIALAWTVVLESLLAALGLLVAYWWYSGTSRQGRLSADRTIASPLLRESMPYLWSSVAMLLCMKVDVVMLGYLSSNAETGIYSLAQKVSEVLYIVPVVLIDSAYPTLAKRFLYGERANEAHGQMLFDLAVGGSLVATFIAVAVAGQLMALVFGDTYRPSVLVFYLHAWSCIAIAMNSARHRWLATVALQRYAPTVTIIGLLSNVVLNLMLIPTMGAVGAAVSTIISYFLSGYVSSFLLPPLRGIGVMQTRALWPWGRLLASARAFRN